MSEDQGRDALVPVWTIATEPDKVVSTDLVPITDGMTAARLTQLRNALISFLDTPLVSLEAHEIPKGVQLSGGRVLEAASPLAIDLAELVKQSAGSLKKAPNLASSGETLYRMIVPAEVAQSMGQGLMRSMPSAAKSGAIHGGILSKAGIVAQASFVPVVAEGSAAAGTAAAGAAVAGTAAAGVTAVGVVTVAAPFVLLAIATAATIHAEKQRQIAIQRVTDLLQEMKSDALEKERDELSGCTPAIEKATAILLDEGIIGHSLGLDSAVHTIDTAIETAASRVSKWRKALDSFPEGGVDSGQLKSAFVGIRHTDGEFQVKLRMASLAIAMKRRVAVLQAVEHAQKAPEMSLPRFTNMLQREQTTVDKLESDLADFLTDLSHVRIQPSRNLKYKFRISRSQAEYLLSWPVRLRDIADTESPVEPGSMPDCEIGIVHQRDGKLRVLEIEPVIDQRDS